MVDRGRCLGNPENFKYSEQRTHLEVEQGLIVQNIFLKLIWYGQTTEHKYVLFDARLKIYDYL